MTNPFLLPVGDYAERQWAGFVEDLCALVATGWDTPHHIEHRRALWGITPQEVPAALLDAHLHLDNGWGRPERTRHDTHSR